MKKVKITGLLFVFLLTACGENIKPTQKPSIQDELAQALVDKNIPKAQQIKQSINLSQNNSQLLDAYFSLETENVVFLSQLLSRMKLDYPYMDSNQQMMYEEMQKWLKLKQIYRKEIAPPVRILQREQLYLAPSNINFKLCPNTQLDCASIARTEIGKFISDEEITIALKRMALKDPCVNLSSMLQDENKANRCLKKSKGGVNVELLAKPRFNKVEWKSVIK